MDSTGIKINKFIVTKLIVAFVVMLALLPSPTKLLAESSVFSGYKSQVDNYLSQITSLQDENTDLEENRKKLIKMEGVQSYGGYSEVESYSDVQKGREYENQISENNAEIKEYENKIAITLKMMASVAGDDEDLISQLEETTANVNSTLNKTGQDEEIPVCWTWRGGFHWQACFLGIFASIIGWIVYFFGSILWVAGAAFDFSIFLSITLSNWFFSRDFIGETWKLVRDLSNIFFLFVLLYIAIGTIFELRSIGNPQKMVVNLVIVALLVNFSGFFVRIVVDASNVVAYEFYKTMSGEETTIKEKAGNLGSRLVGKLTPSTYLVKEGNHIEGENYKLNSTSVLGTLLQGVFSILIIIVAAFVLFTASLLFIIRTVVLLFVYILSPLAFVSQIIPSPKFNYFQQWLEHLIKQSLYAPGFLIPLFLVYIMLGDNGLSSRDWSNITSTGGYWVGGVMNLIGINMLIVGLLVACLFIAQKFGAAGLSASTSFGSKATQMLAQPFSRYGGRAAGWAGRQITRPLSQERKDALKERWKESRLNRSWNTGVLKEMRDTKAAQVVGQAARNPLFTATAGVGKMAGAMGVKGMDNILGKETFGKAVEAKGEKYLADMRKLLTDQDKARYIEGLTGVGKKEEFRYMYSKMSPEERQKLESEMRSRAKDNKGRSQSSLPVIEEARRGLRLKEAQETASEMLKGTKPEKENDPLRIEAIRHLDKDDFIATFKKLSKNDQASLARAIASSGDSKLGENLSDAQKKLKDADKRALERESASRESLEKINEKVKLGQKQNIKQEDVINLSRENLLELSDDVLTDENFAKHLTVEQLRAIRNSDITGKTKNAIRNSIEGVIERARKEASGTGGGTSAPVPMPQHLVILEKYFRLGGAGFGD